MKYFRVKTLPECSSDYRTIYRAAMIRYRAIASRTKRRPYVRSAYFGKEKIFLTLFWQHLHDKNWRDRKARLRFYHCAIELLQETRHAPITKPNVDNASELLHRFGGITKYGEIFYVQIKENISNKQKYLVSIFPC